MGTSDYDLCNQKAQSGEKQAQMIHGELKTNQSS